MSYWAQYWGRHTVPKIRGGSSGLDASGKKHSGAGGGDSGGQEGEDRWTLRTFRREKLGSIKSQKMWRERTGGGSPNHDDGGSLGQRMVTYYTYWLYWNTKNMVFHIQKYGRVWILDLFSRILWPTSANLTILNLRFNKTNIILTS